MRGLAAEVDKVVAEIRLVIDQDRNQLPSLILTLLGQFALTIGMSALVCGLVHVAEVEWHDKGAQGSLIRGLELTTLFVLIDPAALANLYCCYVC